MPENAGDCTGLLGEDDLSFSPAQILYHAGTILHKDTTKEDKSERIRLLNLVYG